VTDDEAFICGRRWNGPGPGVLPPINWVQTSGDSIQRLLSEPQSIPSPHWGKVLEFADDSAQGGYFIGVISGVRGIVYLLNDSSAGINAGWGDVQCIASSLSELFARLD
jgi:hypothetical protein